MLTRNRHRQESSLISDETGETVPSARCRICLKEGEIPIFGEEDISEQIIEFGCIEISCLDNLPQHICDACHSLLKAAILFRKTAKHTEEVLKNTAAFESASACSEDLDYKDVENYESDSDTSIKKEYLEYEDTTESESEKGLKYEPEFDNESLANIIQSECDNQVIKEEKEMLPVKVKEEVDKTSDVENELVMIIVSDKDKDKLTLCCVKCNVTFDNHIDYKKHETEYHKNARQQEKCEICGKFIEQSNYRQHIKEHREKYKKNHLKKYGKVDCEVCGKKVNKSYHKYHMKMHGTPEEKAERFTECTICKKTFSAHYFSDHIKRVHDKKQKDQLESPNKSKQKKKEKQLKCPVCDKMIGLNIYKEHLMKHGGPTKQYFCDQCGKVFKHPSAFKTHTLTHGSELKYKCQFCPYRGLHLGLLKIHVRTHTGDYNYRCSECPARFITKSNLSKHILRHQRACTHKCDICNKGFYSKRDVDRHIQTVHLDLKNNICDICGKGFGHRDNMLSHQLKVHNRERMTGKGRIPSYLKEEMNKSNDLQK